MEPAHPKIDLESEQATSSACDRSRLAGRYSGSRCRLHPPESGAPKTKAFHATKDCSGHTGLVGAFCTFRSSNVKALKVGSKIFYFQQASKTALDSDIVIYVKPRHRRNRPLPPSFRDRDRTVHDLGRHGNARRVPSPCTCHGRFVDPEALALGRDVQLQSGLAPVGNRPVSERVARWLSSLSAKYIAVFALLVAVPVIGTSVYLLYSSYQDNKRALTRLQQEKAKSVAVTIDQYFMDLTKRMKAMQGHYLSFTALGSVLQPLLDDHATDAFYVDSTGHKTLASAGGGLTRVKGNFLHDRSDSSRRGRRDSPSVPCTRHGSCPTPEQDRWRSWFGKRPGRDARPSAGTGVFGETLDLGVIQDLVRQTRLGTSGYVYAVDARGVPIAHPNGAAFTHRSLALPQVTRALASSSTGSTVGRNFRGEKVLSTWATVGPVGWKVFVEQPESAAFAPLRGKIWRTALLIAAFVAGRGRALHPARPPPRAPDQAPAGGGRGDRRRRLRRAHRPRPQGRAGSARRPLSTRWPSACRS